MEGVSQCGSLPKEARFWSILDFNKQMYLFNELGLRKAAYIGTNDPAGAGVVKEIAADWQKWGGKVVAEEFFQLGATDFVPQLTKVKAAKPDVIILYPENRQKLRIMEGKAKLVVVPHTSLTDVLDGISTISKALGVERKGEELVSNINRRLGALRRRTAGKKGQKVLLIIGRNPDKLTIWRM